MGNINQIRKRYHDAIEGSKFLPSEDQFNYVLGNDASSRTPEVEQFFHWEIVDLLNRSREIEDSVGTYGEPQGLTRFVESLAKLLNAEYGWTIEPENTVLTKGSQFAFTLLFKFLTDRFLDGSHNQVLLSVRLDHIGYSDTRESTLLFRSHRPRVEKMSNNMFKYLIDLDEVEVTKEISTICVSIPTNPNGNFGVALLEKSIENGKILSLWRNLIYLHYKGLLQNATETVHRHFANVPYRLQIAKGTFFLWLWFHSLPASSLVLYRRLKQRGVIIVLGNFFFLGLGEYWLHRDECVSGKLLPTAGNIQQRHRNKRRRSSSKHATESDSQRLAYIYE